MSADVIDDDGRAADLLSSIENPTVTETQLKSFWLPLMLQNYREFNKRWLSEVALTETTEVDVTDDAGNVIYKTPMMHPIGVIGDASLIPLLKNAEEEGLKNNAQKKEQLRVIIEAHTIKNKAAEDALKAQWRELFIKTGFLAATTEPKVDEVKQEHHYDEGSWFN